MEASKGKRRRTAIGKDEMNLLEYCVFSATNRVDRKTKSLLFEDPAYCRVERRSLTRRLTVAFSAQYGRPTACDDMVLLAMLKKSRDEGFASQRVHFSRYELLQVLGWPDNGQNYDRIDQALNRIIGTHLVWDNAFWDNREKSWVDRKFSIIDDVQLYDREKYSRAQKRLHAGRPRSWFKWSDVMFESFQAGYIKSVDFELLQRLSESVAKRLYRWLDKHFNNPRRKLPLEISLVTLATQKLGFQSAPPSHLKRMLRPAIEELESISYLAAESPRFIGSGRDCIVRFRPMSKPKRIDTGHPRSLVKPDTTYRDKLSPVAQQLASRGVSKQTAKFLARTQQTECERQLEHLDWLLESNWKPDRGTGAWLVAAIKKSFQPPAGFITKAERDREHKERAALQESRQRGEDLQRKKQKRAELVRTTRVGDYLAALPKRERGKLEEAAIETGDDFIRNRLQKHVREGDAQMTAIYREKLIRDYVESILQLSRSQRSSRFRHES